MVNHPRPINRALSALFVIVMLAGCTIGREPSTEAPSAREVPAARDVPPAGEVARSGDGQAATPRSVQVTPFTDFGAEWATQQSTAKGGLFADNYTRLIITSELAG